MVCVFSGRATHRTWEHVGFFVTPVRSLANQSSHGGNRSRREGEITVFFQLFEIRIANAISSFE